MGLVDAINKRAAGVETAEQRKQAEMKRRQEETSRTIPKSALQIALTSAFRGNNSTENLTTYALLPSMRTHYTPHMHTTTPHI